MHLFLLPWTLVLRHDFNIIIIRSQDIGFLASSLKTGILFASGFFIKAWQIQVFRIYYNAALPLTAIDSAAAWLSFSLAIAVTSVANFWSPLPDVQKKFQKNILFFVFLSTVVRGKGKLFF